MADPEGPSPDAKHPAYNVPPAAKPLAPVPRVKPSNINTPKEAPPAGGPPGFGDFLEWMRNQVAGESVQGETAQRGPIPKEKKKFQRLEADAKTDKTVVPTAPDAERVSQEVFETPAKPRSAEDASARNVAPTAETDSQRSTTEPAAAEPLTPRVRRQQAGLKRNVWLGLLTQLGVLAALVGSFLFGRLSVSKVAPTAPSAPAAPETVNSEGKATTKLLSDANATLIDQAMAAEQNSDFKKAASLLEQVKASGEHVRGLTYQMATLAVFAGDFNRALPLLNNTLTEGEDLADAYNLRATVSSRTGLVRQNGMNDFETATKIDPFSARNFFYWGEALRRVGKAQAAAMRLQQAVDRLREPELESVYRLKLRLARIEAGKEQEFAGELAWRLALPNPDMDWLITAAAVEIHHGKFDAAAGYLDRAAQRGDRELFTMRLRDYYLHQFKYQKELSRFYAKTPQAKTATEENPPAPDESTAPASSSLPPIRLDAPASPPPAFPGATLPR